jgi:hypothetical protein
MRLLTEGEIRRELLIANPNISEYHRHLYATAIVRAEGATEAAAMAPPKVETVTAEDVRSAIGGADIHNAVVIQLASSAVMRLLKSKGVPT